MVTKTTLVETDVTVIEQELIKQIAPWWRITLQKNAISLAAHDLLYSYT